MQVLPESLVICEHEGLVGKNRTARSRAKLIALKWRRRPLIKKICRIQLIVPQKFVCRTMPLVPARLRADDDLRAGSLAKLRAIRVAVHVELAHRVDTQ